MTCHLKENDEKLEDMADDTDCYHCGCGPHVGGCGVAICSEPGCCTCCCLTYEPVGSRRLHVPEEENA